MDIQFPPSPRLIELQEKAEKLAKIESDASIKKQQLDAELYRKKEALEQEYRPKIMAEFNKQYAVKKERELLKSQIDSFYANDGETLAALFVQYTGIALNEAFMYGNGKSARIALYDKATNHFGIYSYKPNAKGERALLTVPNLANCKYAFEVAKKLGEFFEQCKKNTDIKNCKDLANAGKYGYDRESCEAMADSNWAQTFSIAVFELVLKSGKKELKRGKTAVRIKAACKDKAAAFEMADKVVELLEIGKWDSRKTVKI